MPLTEYDNLTGEQKTSVTKMYADLSDLRSYLYDWDEKGYHGRTLKHNIPRPPTIKLPKPEPEQEPEPEKPKATRKRRSKKSK